MSRRAFVVKVSAHVLFGLFAATAASAQPAEEPIELAGADLLLLLGGFFGMSGPLLRPSSASICAEQ